MSKDLWFRLVIPLGVLSALTLLISLMIDKSLDISSLMINLATEFIMVIITVIYVDWVIRSSEEKKWSHVYKHIGFRIDAWIFSCTATLYNPLDVFMHLPKGYHKMTVEEQTRLLLTAAINITRDSNFEKKVREIGDEEWDMLISDLKEDRKRALSFLDIFGSKLSPDQTALLSQIEFDLTWLINVREMYNMQASFDEPETPYETGWVWEWSEQESPEIIERFLAALEKLSNLHSTLGES
jgi:hypothetical protein